MNANLTLSDFLLARYAEEDAEAQGIVDRGEFGFNVTAIDTWEAYGAHIEVGVGRALAEVEAKRRIVEEESGWVTQRPDAPPHTCGSFDGQDFIEIHGPIGSKRIDGSEAREFIDLWYVPSTRPSRTLKLLAQPYVDHPDYRQEWRP